LVSHLMWTAVRHTLSVVSWAYCAGCGRRLRDDRLDVCIVTAGRFTAEMAGGGHLCVSGVSTEGRSGGGRSWLLVREWAEDGERRLRDDRLDVCIVTAGRFTTEMAKSGRVCVSGVSAAWKSGGGVRWWEWREDGEGESSCGLVAVLRPGYVFVCFRSGSCSSDSYIVVDLQICMSSEC
jgi:hypothetical protein